MKCSKCGYEIKEGNLFCTNCGEKLDVKNDVIQTDKKSNKIKGKIKIRVWHIIVLFIVIISIIIGTILLKQKEKINTELEFENTYQQELNNNVEQEVEEVKEQEKEKIEIGKKYICSTTGSDGYVIFNEDNTLEIQIGDVGTEYYTLKGTYTINNNTIDVHINYDSAYLVISIDEDEEKELDPSFKEYDTVIKILKDGELEYTNEYDQKYIFKLDSAEKEKDKEKRDLLQSIYDKYPELESKDGYICTDGEQYWILDNSGKKVYFDDLESFESALVNRNKSDENIDRKIFLSSYLTDKFKEVLRENVLEYKNEQKEENFIEDRIECSGDEIIYTYLYISQTENFKPNLNASIYVITPNKKLPIDMDTLKSNFHNYFVSKRTRDVNEMFYDYNGVLTDKQIKEKKHLVNKQITEIVNEVKNNIISLDTKERLGREYFTYIANIPNGYKELTYSSKYSYVQRINSNKVLVVRTYRKITKFDSYKVSDYTEHISVGVCLTLNELPYMAQKFTIQELIQTGYVTENRNDCVITPIKKVMATDEFSVKEYEKMYSEQDKYIREYFGL